VRDFIGGFHGFTGTAKRSAVLENSGLFRATLGVFFDGDRVDHAGIAQLLLAMQSHSRLVKPAALGLIGEENFRSVFAEDNADQDRFRYCPPRLRAARKSSSVCPKMRCKSSRRSGTPSSVCSPGALAGS